jgi:adenylate cyclase
MLQVLYETEGRTQVVTLSKEIASIGRANDNDIVLNDFSVSRRHAFLKKENGAWYLYDNQSTNGVRVNDKPVPKAAVNDGDRALIGTFLLRFRDEPAAVRSGRFIDSTSTRIRPIAEFNEDFGLEKSVALPAADSTAERRRAAVDVPYKSRVFEILVQVAKALISADDLATVLDKVMDLIFEFLSVDRGFLLLEEEGGVLTLRISRLKSSKRPTADGTTPYSRTIVDMVFKQKAAVLTSDAQTDQRFESGESIRMQQIRSAMCAPLWNRDSVIGVIYVDSPMHAGSFSDQDLDLLTALANFAAVAIERARLHEKVVEEKRIRGRLERYHSPQVVEDIIADANATGELKAVRTKVVTILFADVVGFTTWSERMPAETLARLLTEFFTLSSDAVFACGGTIDKFIGDAIMAFFGAPIDQPDHADRAVAAALKIREGLVDWNRERVSRGEPALEVRIALNTGEAIVGDIGSERRVDYTVLGNAVNVAARLEEFVAQPGEIVMGPDTWEAVRHRYEVAQLGFFSLKGLSAQVPLYKVLSALDPGE